MTLRDIPLSVLHQPMDPLLREIFEVMGSGSAVPVRLAEGVYEASLNFDHALDTVVTKDFDFSLKGPEHKIPDTPEPRDPKFADIWNTPAYGICDNYAQVLEQFPDILSCSHNHVLLVTLHRRADQDPHGGWRWNKWGEYIGVHEPTMEYLYDEPDITQVYTYSILQYRDGVFNEEETDDE